MALNLSTLTNPATSGGILAEALTTADFLDPVPILKNLSRGSNKGGDAKQTTALNQPRALPLIKNPAGDLGGYLYIPNVSGNYATGPSVTIGSNQTWEGEVDMVIKEFGDHIFPMGGGVWATGFGLIFYFDGNVRAFSKGIAGHSVASGVTLGTPFNAKYGYDGTNRYVKINDSVVWSDYAGDQSVSLTTGLQLNQQTLAPKGNYAIQKAKLTVNSAVVFDCDFNGSTSIRHGDTKFQAAVGGPVTINQSGNDPATVIKKSVLRFDGANDGLQGLFNQTITEGYMFAAFSVLGDGGENYGRVFGVNSTGEADNGNPRGYIFSLRNAATNDLSYYYDINYRASHTGLFDDELRDILHESKAADGTQVSKVNNSDIQTTSVDISALSSEEYNIAFADNGNNNAAIDLEFLALFPATITDAQADDVRNYINNRNNVFLRHDTDGYYFFDPLSLAADAPVSSWNGQIVGSDNDANLTITQSTANSQPDRLAPDKDGMVVRFNDSNDHLIVPSGFVEPAAGSWQVVGTSLGTFAYRVNANAVTELNLLGNLGSASYRQAGDLYGIILLPESATGKDIEDARKLLIDRGAADGASGSSFFAAWYTRQDIVEFKPVDMSNVTNVQSAWNNTSLTNFPALDLSSSTSFYSAWRDCSNLVTMGAINAENGTQFSYAWRNCSALTSFPAGAKLGTSASSVGFHYAWQGCSSLTSFSVALPSASSLDYAWQNCSSLTSFSSELPLADSAVQAWQGCSSLTSFSAALPSASSLDYAWLGCSSLSDFRTTDIKNCTNFTSAWHNCSALTSFPSDALLGTAASNVNFTNAWRNSGLTSFPALDLSNGKNFVSTFASCSNLTSLEAGVLFSANANNIVFYLAFSNCTSLVDFPAAAFDSLGTPAASCFLDCWSGCAALSANSVENILVSINTSGKSAPSTNPQITIDYDGTTLSAATNTAIDSLSGKGWEVYINGVLVIPNILDLAPAAAYSLRSFDANADPNVVNVRRSSDSALRDFKASEVSDGTLRDWTLGDTLSLENNRMYFDGVDDYVDLNQSLIPATGDFSVSLKYAHQEQTATNRYILNQGSSINTFFGLGINYDAVNCYVGGIDAGVFGTTSISKGSIYEFKVTRVGDVFTLYVDGVSVGTQTNVGLTISTNTNTYIGQATWTTGRFTKGTVYDIKKDDTLYYEGYGNTNADWTDQVGSSNATVNGTPALFSGQGFDGHVTTWYDQGGTNHAAQSDDAKQPKIVDGGTLVTESGKPALDFDGTDDYLDKAFTLDDVFSQFVVAKHEADNDFIIDGITVNSASLWTYENTQVRSFVNGNLYQNAAGGSRHLYSVSNNLTDKYFKADNQTAVTGTGGAVTVGGVSIGGSANGALPLLGTIQEIVIYDTEQSANRTGIENNINDHFDIY